ncbi:MAG: ABC transporter permease subunit, partial [Burkholderiales bacterium]
MNSLAQSIVIVGLLAIGETVVIVAGALDISVGSIASVASVFSALIVTNGILGTYGAGSMQIAILAGLAAGMFCGVINGLIVTVLKVNPIIATLGTLAALAGLAFLIARPELDLHWEHHPSHFWLVLLTAGVNVALAYVTNVAAGRYRDARLVLISLGFLASAGFLGLHALATPGVLLAQPNVGFVVATPVGLAIAALFAAASTSSLAGPRARTILRGRPILLWGLIGLMVVWGAMSLAQLPPLDGPPPAKEGVGGLQLLAVLAIVLYAFAATRSLRLHQLRGGTVLLTIAIAMILLAEAMIAIVLSRNWQLSWWEWHVLMAISFAAIGAASWSEWYEERFSALYL